MNIQELEQRIMESPSKVISKDAAQTVINGYKRRLNELEDELHQLRNERLYEPNTSAQNSNDKSDWKMLQQFSVN